MKALLINPSWDAYVSQRGSRINRAWPPLDLLNCAALLRREGIEADLLDARAVWMSPEDIAKKSEAYDLVFVTSSPLDRWQCPNLEIGLFFERMKPLKHPRLYIMGVHGTHYPEALFENTAAQAVIQGEPEWTVLDIALGKPLRDIPGLAYRDGEKIVRTPPRPLADLTQFPIPAFDLLKMENYGYEILGDQFVLLETTRGCPFPCTFCMRDMYGGKAYRYKTPEQVARDVEAALKQGARTGYFIDLEFSLNRDYTMNVCKALMPFKSQWKWCVQTRADSIDPELLRMMKDAGCALIHFGVETGSDTIMKQIDKRITLEQIQKGVAQTQQAGIEAACFFMLGFPGETEADREKTLEFAKQINPTYASFHIVNPYPGTPLYKTGTWDQLYPDTVLDRANFTKLQQWEKHAYRRYYLRLGFLVGLLQRSHPRQLLKQARLLWAMV